MIISKAFARLVAVLGLALASASSYSHSLLGQEPAASKIFTASNGLEWVYASPCAAVDPSCGHTQLHHGFHIASAQEWLSSFTDLNALIAAFDLTHYSSSICSSPEFSVEYDHCDPSDVLGGYVWNSPLVPSWQASNPAAESFLVRGAQHVPEPSILMLLSLGLIGLGLKRRAAK